MDLAIQNIKSDAQREKLKVREPVVIEYVAHFNQLSKLSKNIFAEEKDKTDHFEQGLKQEICSSLSSHLLTTRPVN